MLIESMRDIGYSLETALADLVDNSITSGASRIDLFIDPGAGAARLGVLDNGRGMTRDELFTAMRPGSRSPLDEREASDLGRFGLGLKTASFSQCRRLTVVTRHDRATAAAIWDLSYVADQDEWLVLVPPARDIAKIPWIEHLGGSGTLVVWENLDRVCDEASDEAQTQFTGAVDIAVEHLELVFHRFLAGEHGLPRVTLTLNDRPLRPFDPFHAGHPATIVGPTEHIRLGRLTVSVQCFTLPHHRKVTPAEWDRYAGRAGYLKNQGFYVYRGKRLIVSGTWFGLARQMELTKLARVRIDIPNKLDAAWKIDVKKASAHPPFQVRERLRKIIEPLIGSSKRVYTSRGQVRVTDSRLPVWNRVQNKNEIHYHLNPDHPVVERFRDRLPKELQGDFARILELAGTALPVDALFADLGGTPEQVTGTGISDDTLLHAVAATVTALRGCGRSPEEITDMLRFAEPFRSNWKRTEGHLLPLLAKDGPSDG